MGKSAAFLVVSFIVSSIALNIPHRLRVERHCKDNLKDFNQ